MGERLIAVASNYWLAKKTRNLLIFKDRDGVLVNVHFYSKMYAKPEGKKMTHFLLPQVYLLE